MMSSFDQFGGDEVYPGPDSFSDFNAIAPDSHPPTYASEGATFFSSGTSADSPILPAQIGAEEGYTLREWRRQNAIRLDEKEKKEKELLSQVVAEAEEYKAEFHKKREITCETNKTINREKEKVSVASQMKFHAEADKDYWEAIAELIPKEAPAIDNRKDKKVQEKKSAVVMVQGPKPGKPTDLVRMRQLLIKLKHNTPPHLKPSEAPEAPAVVNHTEAITAA